MSILEEIEKIKLFALEEISKAKEASGLEDLRVKYLGRNGNLTHILRSLEKYPLSDRKNIGKLANEIRLILEKEINERKKTADSAEYKKMLEAETVDVTASINKISAGHLHSITQTQEKVEQFFSSMGFENAEGPEIETEFYNFDALNMPADHPSRDMQDTFWLKPEKERLLMRTQTSAVQIHYMETHKPPFRIFSQGRVFRREALDVRHEATFYQFEGLMVGDNITVANIKSIFEIFLNSYFGVKIETRLRPSYFPFVEPAFELDFRCLICGGKGCKVCKGAGWIEVIPGGMVHQNVFVNVGYPRNKYQGYAFCIGFTRLAMMRYGIDDIRLFHSGDLRFLKQF